MAVSWLEPSPSLVGKTALWRRSPFGTYTRVKTLLRGKQVDLATCDTEALSQPKCRASIKKVASLTIETPAF